jgi:hypothetical protein
MNHFKANLHFRFTFCQGRDENESEAFIKCTTANKREQLDISHCQQFRFTDFRHAKTQQHNIHLF